MTPKELFGVFVRLTGLGFLVFALFDFYYVITKVFGIPTSSQLPLSFDVTATIFFCVIGLAFLLGANFIVRIAYAFSPKA